MKKVIIGFFLLLISGQLIIAQPVSDNAVIPMGITISAVLRLNVVSGGNIEFVFSSIPDFQNGLGNTDDLYRTNLTVESSIGWGLTVQSSDFNGSAGSFSCGIVDYTIEENTNTIPIVTAAVVGTPSTVFNGAVISTGPGTGTHRSLSTLAFQILSSNPNAGDENDGDAAANNFYVRWRCGVPAAAVPPGPGDINAWPGVTAGGSGRSSANVLISIIPN